MGTVSGLVNGIGTFGGCSVIFLIEVKSRCYPGVAKAIKKASEELKASGDLSDDPLKILQALSEEDFSDLQASWLLFVIISFVLGVIGVGLIGVLLKTIEKSKILSSTS